MSDEYTCGLTLPIPGALGGGSRKCGRLLTDRCGFCMQYDKHAVDWITVFGNPPSAPRKAVDGDIFGDVFYCSEWTAQHANDWGNT